MPLAGQYVQEPEDRLLLVVAGRGYLFLLASPLVLPSDSGQLMDVALILIQARRLRMRFDGLVDGVLPGLCVRVAFLERQFRTPPDKAQVGNQAHEAAFTERTTYPLAQMPAQQSACPGGAF